MKVYSLTSYWILYDLCLVICTCGNQWVVLQEGVIHVEIWMKYLCAKLDSTHHHSLFVAHFGATYQFWTEHCCGTYEQGTESPKCTHKAPAMSRWLSQVYPAFTHIKISQEKKKRHFLKFQYPEFEGTHHSISNYTLVGTELRVDIGEKPGERTALESGSQGFSSRNIPNVYSWVLLKEAHQYKFTYSELRVICNISPLWRKLAYKVRIN